MKEFTGARTGEALEKRVARLEDIEDIKNLKERYAALCDNDYDPDGLAALFVEDAKWESNLVGSYHGRDAIREYMRRSSQEITWAEHFVIAPVVNVAADGQTATGTWFILLLGTMSGQGGLETNLPVIVAANYSDTFVKVDGEWRFKSLYTDLKMMADIREGWAEHPFGRENLPQRMAPPTDSGGER